MLFNTIPLISEVDTLSITPDRTSLIGSLTKSTPYSEKPYIAGLDLTYTNPSIALYENLNADLRLHKRMTKYYKYKCIDKWIHEDLVHVLNFFKQDLDKTKKINILKKEILTKDRVYSILLSFTANTKTNWYDLHKNEKYLKDAFSISIRKLLKKDKHM